jgi:hypothetical protein
MRNRLFRELVCMVAAIGVVAATAVQPAAAAFVGTEQALAAAENATVARNDLSGWIARDDVRAQLIGLGVDPAEAAARVVALTDAELAEIGHHLDSLPAGGNVLALLGAVFVVLLVLDLVGVIDIFSRT